MKPLSSKTRRIYFIIFFTLFLLGIPLVILYAIGYRITATEGIIQTGGIFINNDSSAAEVYVNQELVERSGFFSRDYYIQDLIPGTFEVMVVEDEHQTWRKNFTVVPTLVTEADPFLLPVAPGKREVLPYTIPASVITTATGTINRPATTTATSSKITTANPEYQAVTALFATTTTYNSRLDIFLNAVTAINATTTDRVIATSTATSSEPKINQNITIYKDGKDGVKIFAEWLGRNDPPFFFCPQFKCQTVMQIFEGKKKISHFDFFPGRNNLLIVADSEGVVVAELDTRGNQNIQPLYLVPGATFRVGQGGVVYVKDRTRYFALSL